MTIASYLAGDDDRAVPLQALDELIPDGLDDDPGAFAVEELLAGGKASTNGNVAAPVPQGRRGPKLVDPDDVEIRDVEWLVRHFVCRNTLNLIQGHGGTNKGTWCCYLGARATRGELSDDHAPMMVLYACAEDEKETVLKPRLLAAGADLRYVRFLEDWTFPRDIDSGALQARVREVSAALLFVDPLVTFMDRIDAHKDQEVKQSLTVLLQMAQEERCTTIGVHHFTKDTRLGALLSGNGSGAFGNTARLVLAMVSDDEDDALRILEVVKTNGGPCYVNRLYRLELRPVDGLKELLPTLVDIGESTKSVDALLAVSSKGKTGKLLDAKDIILRELEAGPQPMEYLKARAAADADSSPSGDTTWRAANSLKADGLVRTYQTVPGAKGSKWLWELCEHAESTSATGPANPHGSGTSPDSLHTEVLTEVVPK